MTSTTIDLERLKSSSVRTSPFVDGAPVEPFTDKTFRAIYPGDGRHVADIAACSTEDVDRAVASARRAFEKGSWSRMPGAERKRVMLRFSELILAHRDELAALETLNVGKPIARSRAGDIPSAASCIAWFGEAIDKIYGEVADTGPDMTTMIVREPLGVVAAVVPWNFPLSMAAWKLGPSLATGNSVVLKPAEQSPFTALRIAELAVEAGIPKGVLNVVPGLGEEAGKALGLHMDIDCVTFTGSTEVGKLFLQYAGQSNAKRVSLELGGKSPQVVLDDCEDLNAAATAIAAGIFGNAGQVCNAGSRLIVSEGVKDQLLERITAIAADLKPGNPFDESTRLGAIVSREQLDRVMSYIEVGTKEGARAIIGGGRALEETGGFYAQPTIFDNVDNKMRIAQEEIFGPVLATITARDFDDAMRLANDTIYGLSAAIWTRDVRLAHRAAKELRAGVVWINCFDKGSMAVPFGGFKQSGFGRDKSIHAMEKYTDLKAIWIAS